MCMCVRLFWVLGGGMCTCASAGRGQRPGIHWSWDYRQFCEPPDVGTRRWLILWESSKGSSPLNLLSSPVFSVLNDQGTIFSFKNSCIFIIDTLKKCFGNFMIIEWFCSVSPVIICLTLPQMFLPFIFTMLVVDTLGTACTCVYVTINVTACTRVYVTVNTHPW